MFYLIRGYKLAFCFLLEYFLFNFKHNIFHDVFVFVKSVDQQFRILDLFGVFKGMLYILSPYIFSFDTKTSSKRGAARVSNLRYT